MTHTGTLARDTSAIDAIRARHPELVAFRRDLHAHPELGFEEHRTAARIAEALAVPGIECHGGIGRTGLVALVRGCRDDRGRAIGLRADIDALPMHEEGTLPYA